MTVKRDNKSAAAMVSLAAAVLLLLLFLWRKKLITTGVTTSIDYNGTDITGNNLSLSDLLCRMFSNEFINNGKLCSTIFGVTTCYDGDPVDVLIQRSDC